MKLHASAEVDIERPATEVFKWLAEPNLAARWQPDVAGYAITHRTDDVVGTEFIETLAKGKRSAQLHGRIVEFAPGEVISFALAGAGVEIAAKYRVRSSPTGAVVRADLAIDTPGRLPPPLRPAVKWQTRRQLRRELKLLRHLCEAERSADTKEASDA